MTNRISDGHNNLVIDGWQWKRVHPRVYYRMDFNFQMGPVIFNKTILERDFPENKIGIYNFVHVNNMKLMMKSGVIQV